MSAPAAADVEGRQARPPRRSDLPAPAGEAHLVGAAGAGMRGVAVLLAGAGWSVSGCDRSDEPSAPEITGRGGTLHAGHDPAHVAGAALVVRSSAVPDDHPEIEAAREAGVPVWTRARALAALVNDRTLVAVAGTHGKTTITAMTTLAAAAAGLDPTGVVGGQVPEWDANARAGGGEVAVVEADEYDGSFLALDPALAVVSSVEPEHLESYDGSEAELRAAFRRFAERARGRRGVLYCADDEGARALGRELGGASYGFSDAADYRVTATGTTPSGRLEGPDVELEFELAAPGRHNLQNAAVALAAVLRLGGDADALRDALAEFRGVDRRLQRLADAGGVAVIDDYAHHPTEVRASMAAARGEYPARRLVAVFQPHLFSRTQHFAAEFAAVLSEADEALVLEVYPAREDPIPGVDSDLIVGAADGLRRADRDDALERVRAAEDPVVFLFMGAGDVTGLAHEAAREVTGRGLGA